MARAGRDGATPTRRLFARYALASLVPVLVLGVVLGRSDQAAGTERGLSSGRAQAAVIEQMAIAPSLDGHDLSLALNDRELDRLRRATDLAIFSGSVERLQLRSFAGDVVFSDDGVMRSALPAGSEAFAAAAAGTTSAAVVSDPRIAPGRVVRVLQPVVPAASGRAVGVLELHLPYEPIAAAVQRDLRRTYAQLAGGLGALYVVLALISWSTTRRLSRHAAAREHQATHDALTGLPNRERFRTRAEAAVRGEPGAVVLVDLDRFKEVNDTLGHHAGDRLLQVVAHRLRRAIEPSGCVARIGGDEFGVLLSDPGSDEEAVALLARVRRDLSRDVEIDGVTMSIEASFGIARYPEHGRDVQTLLQHADTAMYRGKRDTSGVVLHRPGQSAAPVSWLAVQSELRTALAREEMVLHYQPKVDLATGRVTGVEALLRWDHPRRGLLLPAHFLPAAEQSGLIEPMTAWVLRQALTDRRAWAARGASWTVAVNVSARNLASTSLVPTVEALLMETGTAPQALLVEITETALAADPGQASAALRSLGDLGVTVSIDDFGSGYTSLSQLRELCVGEIKVDRMFVADLPRRPADVAIVRSVIELAHGLGAAVTAEGVETEHAAAWLRSCGADRAQGYHFARPAPWTELLARWPAPAPAPVPGVQPATGKGPGR